MGVIAMGERNLRRHERLRKREDFQRVMHEGRFIRHPLLTLAVRPNGLMFSRIGLSVGKRIGNAVNRNQVKRRIREAFRLHKREIVASHDVVFFARSGLAESDYRRTERAVEQLLRRADIGVAARASDEAVGE